MYTILYIGPLNLGGTCYNRLQALLFLGYNIIPLNTGYSISNSSIRNFFIKLFRFFFYKYHIKRLNIKILDIVNSAVPDLVWIDKGLTITPQTLHSIKSRSPKIKILSYSPDDMLNPNNSNAFYVASIPLYNLHVTTKSYNLEELKVLGAKDVLFCNNSYSPLFHINYKELQNNSNTRIGFIGSFEVERYNSLLHLAKNGLKVYVYGDWPKKLYKKHPNLIITNKTLINAAYAYEISKNLINLCFLRKVNRDLQTTRSIEIPACGGFMLAEETIEHHTLFKAGVEAEYFNSNDELLDKCIYYLKNPDEANSIANAGYLRCKISGYDDINLIKKIISYLG